MNQSISEIARITEGIAHGDIQQIVTRINTDTRGVKFEPEDIFVSLKGPHFNGHQFISKAFESGCRIFLVEDDDELLPLPNISYIRVQDTYLALRKWATYVRKSRQYLVAGITGSNGKTIVKEWLYQLLHKDFEIFRSPGSYNSRLGVSLSLLQLQPHHQIALLEAGISRPNEMSILEEMIQPQLVILTHMGSAHQEGFENFRQKIREKLKLADHADVLIYGKDQQDVEEEVLEWRKDKMVQVISWSMHQKATLKVNHLEKEKGRTHLQLLYKTNTIKIQLPFTDDASIENALICLSALLAFERFDESHWEAMMTLLPVSMRLELSEGWQNNLLINDAYTSDIHGFKAAIQFLEQQSSSRQKVVIFSPMIGLPFTQEAYKPLMDLFKQAHLFQLYAIGENSHFFSQYSDLPIQSYPDISSFIQNVRIRDFENCAILVKGNRKLELEKIITLFEKKNHPTQLKVNLSAMSHNLGIYRSILPPQTKLMAMVKAFGYGSGSNEIGRLFQHLKVDYLGVAYADEGIALRRNGIFLPIMVMNIEPTSFHIMHEYGLEPAIYSLEILEEYIQYAQHAQTPNPIPGVHIELDTGMHRLGFMKTEIKEAIEKIQQQISFRVISIFSHLSGSDDPELDIFTERQHHEFIEQARFMEERLGYSCILHIQNSAGMSRFYWPENQMARLGLGLHGIDPAGNIQEKLEPVCSFTSRISQIKLIPAGDGIGYNRKTVAETSMKIAIIAAGYADGIPRLYGKRKGKVYIHGVACELIGEICMDMCMADITNLPCQEGDEVTIFEDTAQLKSMAETCQTIPYEILTGISQRVTRIYIQE